MEMIARRNVGDEIAVQRPGDHDVRIDRGVDHAGALDEIINAAGADGEGRRADRAARPDHLAEGAGVVFRAGGELHSVPGSVECGGCVFIQPHCRMGRIAVDPHVARPRGAGAERHVIGHPVRRPAQGVIDHDFRILRHGVRARHRPQNVRQMFGVLATGVGAHSRPGVERVGGVLRRVQHRRDPSAQRGGVEIAGAADRLHPLAIRLCERPGFRLLLRASLDRFARRQQVVGHAIRRRPQRLGHGPLDHRTSAVARLGEGLRGVAVPLPRVEPHQAVVAALHDPEQRVIVFCGNGVELVVVAAGARHRQAEERLAEHVDAVGEAVGLVLAHVHR